jgi:hypothetical protein
MTKTSTVDPFIGIVLAVKNCETTGGAGGITVMLAAAGAPEPASFEAMGDVTLLCGPAETPVTFTEIVQLAEAAMVPPDRLTLVDPAAAVATPPHPFVKVPELAIASPAGKLSVNATPVSGIALALLIVKVKEVVPSIKIASAPDAWLIPGAVRSNSVIVSDP